MSTVIKAVQDSFQAFNCNCAILLLISQDILHECRAFSACCFSYSSSTDGRTCMSKALDYAKNTALSNSQGGRRGQSNVQQDIVLITDG